LTLTLTLSTPWTQARVGTIVCKFGGDRVMFVVEVAICAKFTDRRTHGRTDGQTDRRTDDGRRAIALAHWSELKKTGPLLHFQLVGAYARGFQLGPARTRTDTLTRDRRQKRLTTNQPASQSDSTQRKSSFNINKFWYKESSINRH